MTYGNRAWPHSSAFHRGGTGRGPAEGYLSIWIKLYPMLGSPAHMIVVGKALEDIGRRFIQQDKR